MTLIANPKDTLARLIAESTIHHLEQQGMHVHARSRWHILRLAYRLADTYSIDDIPTQIAQMAARKESHP